MQIDDGHLATKLERGTVDRVVDLVGNPALLDSLRCVGRDGRIVQLDFLEGLEPLAAFNPMFDPTTGVQFSFYRSAFVLGTAAGPLVTPGHDPAINVPDSTGNPTGSRRHHGGDGDG